MYNFKEGYYVDVRIEKRFETNITYRNGVLTECNEKINSGAFIRLYDGNMWYYSSTSIIDLVQDEIDKLYEIASYNKFINEDKIVKKFEINVDEKLKYKDNSIKNIALSDKKQLLLNYTKYMNNYNEIKMWIGLYLDRHSDYEFYSSKGANIKYDYQSAGFAVMYAMNNKDKMFQESFQKSYDNFNDLKYKDDELIKWIDESIHVLNEAIEVVPGDYEVILSPITAGVFAHESFGHKSEADFMIGDEIMKKEWAIGKTIGSNNLSIVDSGLLIGSGYVPYDDEGTKASKTYLIKNGKLSGRLHNAVTACDLEEKVTGNARAINTEYEPIVRMTTTYIEGGNSTFEDLVSSVKKGYFIKTIKHGSGMSTFTIAPSIAYEIIDGKITKPVKISVITGSVFETLGLINGLSKDVHLYSFVTGGCGKMEQYPLNVSFGGPYVKISKMRVQ